MTNRNFLGNHQVQQQQQQYQNPFPNIHMGSISSTGRSNYTTTTNFQPTNALIVDKSVEDTRMIIEQSNRIMARNGVVDEKVVIPSNSYIDQPMLSAMQQMFNNTNGAPAAQKAIYQPQQIYFN
jgi:hypothetical protein